MAAAWNQVDRRRGGQPGAAAGPAGQAGVGASLHRRHLARLTDAGDPVGHRAGARQGARRTGAERLGRAGASPACPPAVTTGAFRRLTRLRGPVVRAALAHRRARVPAVEALTVREDRLTTDWVRVYANPDGSRRRSERPRGERLDSARSPPASRPASTATRCCAVLGRRADRRPGPGGARSRPPRAARRAATSASKPRPGAALTRRVARRHAGDRGDVRRARRGGHRRRANGVLLRALVAPGPRGRHRRDRDLPAPDARRLRPRGARRRGTATGLSSSVDALRTARRTRGRWPPGSSRSTGCRSTSSSAPPSGLRDAHRGSAVLSGRPARQRAQGDRGQAGRPTTRSPTAPATGSTYPALELVSQARPAHDRAGPDPALGSPRAAAGCRAGSGRTGSTTCASSR